jgi:hypothetical protein
MNIVYRAEVNRRLIDRGWKLDKSYNPVTEGKNPKKEARWIPNQARNDSP